MKLCLTGHDFSGKSTILRDLYREAKDDKMSYIHLSYREPTDYDFYKSTLMFSNFLMDRCYLDELIYPKVFNREPKLTLEEAKKLYSLAQEQGIKTIIVECSDDNVLMRRVKLRDGEEEKEVLANLKQIREEYRKLAREFGLMRMDTANLTLNESKEYIRQLIK